MRLIDADALLEALLKTERLEPIEGFNGWDNHPDAEGSLAWFDSIFHLITNAHTVQREVWVSVPIVLTDEMHDAFSDTVCFEFDETGAAITNLEQCYKAMLAAAPSDGTKQLNTKG